MQPRNAYPRSDLTSAQVTSILQDSPNVSMSKGMELLDLDLNVLEDITEFVESFSVSRDSYADLHGTASLVLARSLDWGNAIVRPYVEFTGSVPSAKIGISDTFGGASLDTVKWVNLNNANVTVSGGSLNITAPAGSTTQAIYSAGSFNITGTSCVSQVVDAGNQALTTLECWPIQLRQDTNNRVGWLINQGSCIARYTVNNVSHDAPTAITYNANTHRYFRIREIDGRTFWDFSTDGSLWTNWFSLVNPIGMTNINMWIVFGPTTIQGSSTTGKFANFRLGDVQPTPGSITDTITARFNLGAYYVSGDKQAINSLPRTYQADGFDILQNLADPVGDSYAVKAGTAYVDAVESILKSRGYTRYLIDQNTQSLLPADRGWVIADNPTWLTIVNDLLAAIGYAGIWSDWDGQLHAEQYLSPTQRSPEWTYNMDLGTAMVSFARSTQRDLYAAPNRWVFVQSNRTQSAAPTEGDGMYTFVNQNNGLTSVDARNGRIITKIQDMDVADQAALVAAAQVTIDADISISTHISLNTFPNPLHWHFDRMLYSDPELGQYLDVMATKWTFGSDGADMQHEWRII